MVYWYSTPEDAPEWGAWSKRIEWCQENCQGTWNYKLHGNFQFYNKDDYLMFLLAWS